jgi:segregation and condensation protein B
MNEHDQDIDLDSGAAADERQESDAVGQDVQAGEVTAFITDASGVDEVNAAETTSTEEVAAAPTLQDEQQGDAQTDAAGQELKYVIEATLLAAGRPVTTQQLLEMFDERARPSTEQVQVALALLEQDYASRGIELLQVASGWRIQIRARYVEQVSRLWSERPSKYSRALLETLALVAYRQPITRSEIEEIRGVSISSTIMRTLQERNWIRVVGHREVPGRPELLGTTREFLDYFGLKSLDQLPTLAELKDLDSIGVQLELSGNADAANVDGETAALGGEVEEDAPVEAAADADDPELSADADGDTDEEVEDADDTPTLVASADDDRDSSRHISEPPDDDHWG